jgi:septum formation protein
MPPRLILASTSPYRRTLLARLGVAFTAAAPRCDEEMLKGTMGALPPQALAEALADAKARSLLPEADADVVIGSDQLAEIDGRILGKPGSAARAQEQLGTLSGREHRLVTAMVILHAGRIWRHTDIARLTMRRLDPWAIERYVARDQPLDCAGAYKLEAGGVALFSAIACDDHSAITGLPLLAVTRILADIGFAVP